MRFISSSQIFSGKEFLIPNSVLVLDEKEVVCDILNQQEVDEQLIEHFDGIITPGFINTHCHLELSHLKGVIPKHTGIVDFGLHVIKHRNDASIEFQLEMMREADKEMKSQGIVAVGDISNNTNSIIIKQQSSLHYHTFIELIGLNPDKADVIFNVGKQLLTEFKSIGISASLAPHAPYSASLPLIEKIFLDCNSHHLPTTIHNQESEAENEFFASKTGDYIRLYDTLGISLNYFKPTCVSSLQTIASAFNPTVRTLLVHNTFSKKEDIQLIQNNHPNLFWCLCPNANLYIENTLPNFNLLNLNMCEFTLGTDSLASNLQLSIIDEINQVLNCQPDFELEILLKAATYNGAKFLGIESNYGQIRKGKNSGINLIEGKKGSFTVKKLA